MGRFKGWVAIAGGLNLCSRRKSVGLPFVRAVVGSESEECWTHVFDPRALDSCVLLEVCSLVVSGGLAAMAVAFVLVCPRRHRALRSH
jgi:hypothetical protein